MRFSPRVNWIAGEGADAWDLHVQALSDAERDPDVIVMSVGDPNFATPETITNVAIDALRAGDTHYNDSRGRETLRAVVADHLNQMGGLTLDKDNIAILGGAQNALFTASLCLFSPGDEVIVFDPMYVTYEAFIGVSGAMVVPVRTDVAAGFRPDLRAIRAAITPKTRAIAFSNPSNPAGTVFTREELLGIAEIAIAHDLVVISDEVYASLTFEADHTMIAGLPGMAERTVTIGSLSKSHAMTGWRIGWLAGPRDLTVHTENLALCMLYGLPGFIQEAGIEALTNAFHEGGKMRDIYRKRRDFVVNALKDVEGLTLSIPQSGMFLLIDITKTGLSGAGNRLCTRRTLCHQAGKPFPADRVHR